ncbi:MAG: DUF1464 domain-containing protein [Thermoprotei archaeon]|nr:MAG: DUF1464 domain-containing protein [Thermoprotei archaeon]
MARALGIDPGTKSFDLVVIDNDRVVWEKSIETADIARDPKVLIEAIEEAGRVDLIAGPSGYGTPIVCNEDIIDPYTFALEILLLTRREDIEEGMERGEPGIAVYKAIADTVAVLWEKRARVCYIPSVILLPTVPRYRKINRIDMGTADKMAIAVLGVFDQSRRLGISYEETSFILIEMGYGYNAVLAIDHGRIVDGYGGTLVPTGFLTIGSIDAEVVVAGRSWSRSDVFYGGVSTICNEYSVEKALEKALREETCRDAFKNMYESIVRIVYAINKSLEKPREIILSGRLSRVPEIREAIEKLLEDIAPVTKIQGLPGARISKEAAQGYATVGEGIAHGFFHDLIKHMGIDKARGTVFDYLYHPRLLMAKKRLLNAYMKSIRAESLRKIIGSTSL